MALQAGADANHKDRFSRTALHYAADKGHHALAQALLGAGATSTRRTIAVAHRCLTPGTWAIARWRRLPHGAE
jgi:ankyrin repeat protein